MLEIISHEQCVFGSDGNALPPDDRFGQPHPRSFGGAPRFARLLLDRGIAIPEVCARLSGNAAEFFGLPGVGSVAAGNFADLTVFDPDVIDSAADFRDPFRSPQGIAAVLCSGRIRCF
jgi:N-acyl-D-amino-acid deacylase